jgi:hypothetical protein
LSATPWRGILEVGVRLAHRAVNLPHHPSESFMGVNETFGTINTTLRTLLMLVVAGGASLVGYKGYEIYNEPVQKLADKEAELDRTRKEFTKQLEAQKKEIDGLSVKLADKTKQVEKLELSIRLMQVRHRLARMTVLDQHARENATPVETPTGAVNGNSSKDLLTKIEFVEVNENGDPIGEAREFEIEGDMVYIDYLRVTFDDKYIQESDLDRSTAIALFRRIFGEHQEPVDGFQLDTVGSRPTAYSRGTEMSEFERKIWDDFWLIANDPKRASELGIVAAHGTAVGQRVRPGMTYEIELRATGDMTIKPIDLERSAVNANPPAVQPPK